MWFFGCLFVCLHTVELLFHMLSNIQIDFVSLYRSIIPWIQMGVVHQGDRGCIYSFGIQLDKKGFLSTIQLLLYIICTLHCLTKWCQFLSVCSLIDYKIVIRWAKCYVSKSINLRFFFYNNLQQKRVHFVSKGKRNH